MKIYIAGAITNNPSYREQFKAAEVRLTVLGHAVINPCKHEGFTYREYINMGLCELMHCDAIYMLDGWEESVGAKLEREYAEAVGLRIKYQRADRPFQNTNNGSRPTVGERELFGKIDGHSFYVVRDEYGRIVVSDELMRELLTALEVASGSSKEVQSE